MIHLLVTLKGRTVGRFDVDGPRVRVGRHPDNEVQIDNMSVSRFHCLLEAAAGGVAFEVEDQGSHNGTYLNGARIEGRRPLKSGDVLGLGQFVVAVRIDAEALPREQAARLIAVRTSDEPERRERLAPERGLLVPEQGAAIPLERDLLQLGSAPGLDVALPGPAKAALIVRGYGGFQLVDAGHGVPLAVNDQPVRDRAWLRDHDRLRVGACLFTFVRGLETDGDESTMVLRAPELPGA